MSRYFLYLDEVKADVNHFPYFCLAGCIIEEQIYTNMIIPQARRIKRDIFGSETTIFHEIDLRRQEKDPYRKLKDPEIRKKFWVQLDDLFSTPNLFTVLAAGVNPSETRSIYKDQCVNDEYYIALQIILENFTHFLELNDGYGSTFIESRNPKEDERMQNHFHTLMANGALFLKRNVLQKRLSTISFPLKADNIIGLQIADFIPNPIARHLAGMPQKSPSLFDHIQSKLYDGGINKIDRFGFKKIP